MIYTIGHSVLTWNAFVEMLKAFNIKQLVDVRRFPGSKRLPHFSSLSMKLNLEKENILYHHMESLGGRRNLLKEEPNTLWRNKSFQAYEQYMETEEFKEALNHLIKLSKQHTTVIMCSEALHWRCHRALISDAMLELDHEVKHILSPEKTIEHRLFSPRYLPRQGNLFTDLNF